MTMVTARVHPVHFDECRLSAVWLPTLRPSQVTWAVSLPINGCYHPQYHIHHCHLLLLLSLKADTHFTVPRRVEGWVDLGTAGRVRRPCPRLYIAVAVVINITAYSLSHRSQSCQHQTIATCRDTWVWTTCLIDSAIAGNWTRQSAK